MCGMLEKKNALEWHLCLRHVGTRGQGKGGGDSEWDLGIAGLGG